MSGLNLGAMGPFGWFSIWECYHGVLIMDSDVMGHYKEFHKMTDEPFQADKDDPVLAKVFDNNPYYTDVCIFAFFLLCLSFVSFCFPFFVLFLLLFA